MNRRILARILVAAGLAAATAVVVAQPEKASVRFSQGWFPVFAKVNGVDTAKITWLVAAFVRGVNKAMKELVADPKAAIEALKMRDGLIDVGVETERLRLYVKELLLTPNVKANGFSSVNTKKLDAQIADVMEAFNVKASVTSASLNTDRFLPPKAERLPPVWKE